jgi:haloalkane dehalogenase
MTTFRTPDDRFAALSDWPYEPLYTTIDTSLGSLRVAAIDEGPGDASPVLLMHGEPTWSYLYRHMIAPLVAAGHRVIAPDLPGFGRSDKPTANDPELYQHLVDWMSAWLVANDLRDITLCCQDWGGLIGLRLVARHPERFRGLVITNTGLPTGERPPTEAFTAWANFAATTPIFRVGNIVAGGTLRTLSADEIAAYDAPFPDEPSKAVARQLPGLVPTQADHPDAIANRAAWDVLETFNGPVLVVFSDGDAITRGGEATFIRRIAGAAGQPHRTLEGGGHFVQEDLPHELVAAIQSVAATS